MPAYLQIRLHNTMNRPVWFTVIDNVSGRTVLNGKLNSDERWRTIIASDPNGRGYITYTPKGYLSTPRGQLDDGDVVDMN